MEKITNLKRFRDATLGRRLRQRRKYPEMIEGLRPVGFSWKDQSLVIEYETDDEDLFERVRDNPAWSLEFFGVIGEIRQSSLSARIITPDRTAAFERQSRFRLTKMILRVTFRTEEVLKYETRIPEQSLAHAKGRLEYTFTA